MPQISQLVSTFGSQFFWLAITFGLVYLLIGRSMLPKIQSTVDARNKRIADDLDAARIAHKQADEIEDQYKARQAADRDEAQKVTAEAKVQATKASEKKVRDADKRIATKITKAEADIAAQTEAALSEIESVTAEATQNIVSKLTSAKVTKAKAVKAVKGALANV
ncbi:ATPase [Sphingorhabdus sp. Alg239-R122]|uniref:F0F1 ATP synthase subunit B family protein n=1 Tax=Sphingorhabdus sp. Alg239-R122 TaxID=2305989 RepID=UPI0013DD3DDB|nr:ATPase [Sphingorhabdus sp. Alg239-R122]